MGSVALSILSVKSRCLLGLGVFLILVLMVFVPAAPAAEGPVRARLLRSDEAAVSFEVYIGQYRLSASTVFEGTRKVAIPGFWAVTNPGEPNVPSRTYLVAIPPEAIATVRYTVLGSVPLGIGRLEPMPFPGTSGDRVGGVFMTERYRMDERIYTGYRQEPPAEGETVQFIRHQRVVPVRVTPVRFDAESGETSIITRLRVDVSLSRPAGSRSVGMPDEPPKDVEESPAWERILGRAVINAAEAKKWRYKRPGAGLEFQGAGTSAEAGMSAEAALAGPLVKIKVWETGLYKLTAARAAAGGFPGGEPVTDLHLFKRGYDKATLAETVTDIAFTVREDPGGTAGLFDGQDLLIFYAVRLRDDADRDDPTRKFADFNCLWLGTGGGPTMNMQPLQRGYVTSDTASASFTVTGWYEEDNWFIEGTPPGAGGFYPSDTQIDVYGYNDSKVTSYTIPFTVGVMKPGSSLEVRAELLGGPFDVDGREVTMTISNSLGDTPLANALVPNFDRVAYVSPPVPAAAIQEGENRLVIGRGPPSREGLDVYIMRALVSYESLYRAGNNTLEFDTGSLSGDTSITVTGLTTRDLLLFEVTDPLAPRRCQVADSLFTDVPGGYAFSFRETITGLRRYVLTTVSGITAVSAADIGPGTAGTLIGNPLESGVDALVVCYPGYLDEMQDWVHYRRAQGYKVLMADVNDVYDEFNDGVPNPRAIKNFIRHFYERGDASFVVLVGDASEDNKKVHADSPPNFVPTESFPEYAGGSFNQNEVVTSDKWYVLMDNDFLPGQNDYLPDLIIGRLPAGSSLELQIMLNKIFMFERPTASDFWRRRMIMVADDAWSGDGFTLCYNSGELGFKAAEEEASQIIETSGISGYDVVQFYLSDYTSAFHPGSSCVGAGDIVNATRIDVSPILRSELNMGATLVSIQAHMNRHQIAHELLLTTTAATPVSGSDGKDHRKLTNSGRPFIVIGMGCHFSDYSLSREMSTVNQYYNDVSGDCFAELLMIQNNKGAVASYGSTGFEYLTPNRTLTNIIYDNFFTTPPQDTMVASDRAQVRWILGELLTASEIEYGSSGPIKRYHLLGDPMLRIDAGPPRFEVTVNGAAVQSGDVVFGAAGSDTLRVSAVVSDEVAIEKLGLEIDGVDETGSMTVTPLIDQTLSAARKYRLSFEHKLVPKTYDIVLRAYQAPDTTSGAYHMEAEFVLHVQSNVSLRVNGRVVGDGDVVPSRADYVLDIEFPVVINQSDIEVRLDEASVPGLQLSHPTAEDSTTWRVSFRAELAEGRHTLQALLGGTVMLEMQLVVRMDYGLKQVINYPNPFARDTYFVYINDIEISSGHIDIYTTSGKKIVRLDIPPEARVPGQNAVLWNGRDGAGDEIANGVYIYIMTVQQRGKQSTFTGKMVRIE